VLSNLQKFVSLTEVSDVLISHMHADHFIDLIPYRYALRYGFASASDRPRLHLPPEGTRQLVCVASPFSESNTFFSEVFQVSEYDPNTALRLGELEIRLAPVHHYVSSYAMAITDNRKLAYSSDSGPCDELTQIASGADLFLCNVGAQLGKKKEEAMWGHLTSHEAGTLARAAGVKRLMLSHLWPTCDRDAALMEAKSAFGGPVQLAESSQAYDV
jgi:ribonuclease BN (tRNA processing enzyme)